MKNKILEVWLLGSGINNLMKIGSASREIDYYEKISKYYNIIIFEYGNSILENKNISFNIITSMYKNKFINSIIAPFIIYNKKTTEIDLVRTKQFYGMWTGLIFKLLYKKPLMVRIGYSWSKVFIHERKFKNKFIIYLIIKIELFLLSFADSYIVTTNELSKMYENVISNKKFKVIPNGYNLDKFYLKNISIISYDYIYIGRLIELKNIENMLNIISSDKKILIIGDGPLLSFAQAKKNTSCIGKVDNNNLNDYLNEAQNFISLSKTEGNPKSVFEAILSGRYPILSDIEPHRNIINELGYGTLVNLDKINEGLPLLNNIDFNKLTKFRNLYSMDNVIKKELEFINEVI